MAETIHLPIGPQHPFLKEPAKFDFDIQGEEIVGARMNIGYNHRGIEKACEERNYYQCLYLLERICGICSHSHTTAFCQAVEKLLGLELPKRGLYLRTLVCELERLHSHLLWIGVAAHEVGFDTLFMLVWRDRELVMDALEAISGNRVNYAINTIGGVRRDLTEEQRKKLIEMVTPLLARTEYYADIGTNEPSFVARIRASARCPSSGPSTCAPSGRSPAPRASTATSRRDDPYAAYPFLEFKVITSDECDIFGRVLVRVLELVESCKMIQQMLENLPEGEYRRPEGHAPRPGGRCRVALRGAARRGHPLRARQRHREARAGQGSRPDHGQPRGGVRVGDRLVRGRHPDRHRLHRPLLLLHRPHHRGAQRPQAAAARSPPGKSCARTVSTGTARNRESTSRSRGRP